MRLALLIEHHSVLEPFISLDLTSRLLLVAFQPYKQRSEFLCTQSTALENLCSSSYPSEPLESTQILEYELLGHDKILQAKPISTYPATLS